MSLWGRLTEMAEKANDAIVDNIAPLLDDSDEEYYSDGEERSFGEDEDSDGFVDDASDLRLARKIIETLLTRKAYSWSHRLHPKRVLLFFKSVLARNVLSKLID